MRIFLAIAVLVALGVAFFLWQRGRRLHMRYEQQAGGLVLDPLRISDDDPLMKEAMARAKATANKVRELLQMYPQNCWVKVPFKTSSGAVEHVWAGLISLSDSTITCQILTPPVQHHGEVPSPYSCPASELEDWQVLMPDSTIRGGYTTRVMFQRAKEHYGEKIPRQLAAEMQRYVDE